MSGGNRCADMFGRVAGKNGKQPESALMWIDQDAAGMVGGEELRNKRIKHQ
jgi:hypothetical protein